MLYGSSTVFVLTIGLRRRHVRARSGVSARSCRVAQGVRIPKANKCYSVNEGNRLSFPEGYQQYLDWAQERGYSSRYVGAMVADVHRILLQGGVFMYPPTQKAPKGKLRLMYEANPDGDDRRAGRRQGAERARAAHPRRDSRPTSTSACRSSSAAAKKSTTSRRTCNQIAPCPWIIGTTNLGGHP